MSLTPTTATKFSSLPPSQNYYNKKKLYLSPLQFIRLLLIGIIIFILILTYHTQLSLTSLRHKLQKNEHSIINIQSKLTNQTQILHQYSYTLTKTDLLSQIHSLQSNISHTQHLIELELSRTQSNLTDQLSETLQNVKDMVNTAQDEINSEVSTVKESVDTYVRTTQDQFSLENSFMVYQLAGTFTLLSCLISMWHITTHLRYFYSPPIQRKILAILWMSPIYGITSWLSLVFPLLEGYLAIVKDFYEAYVIYQFLGFLISIIGKGNRIKVIQELAKSTNKIDPPMRICSCLRPNYEYKSTFDLAQKILYQCQLYAMQFVFLKPITTISIVVCSKLGLPSPSPKLGIYYQTPKFWILLLQNASVLLAFSGLLKFYHAVQDTIEWCRPFPKFVCIKGIVFMTFWQGVVISVLANTSQESNIKRNESFNDKFDQYGRQAQNFLICLEMLLFSVAHFRCFPTYEWEPGYQPPEERKGNMKFGENIALQDFLDDLKLIVKHGKEDVDQHIESSQKPKKYITTSTTPMTNCQKTESYMISSETDDSINNHTDKTESSGIIYKKSSTTSFQNIQDYLALGTLKPEWKEAVVKILESHIKCKRTVELNLKEIENILEIRKKSSPNKGLMQDYGALEDDSRSNNGRLNILEEINPKSPSIEELEFLLGQDKTP